MFRRILIANRGEIAVRLLRACREMGIGTVAVYSEADATAPHVSAAERAVCLGPAPSGESYLKIDRLIEAAKQTGAEAIHPGYGFLAENAAFARAVEESGLTFIGPRSEAIERMGDKTLARRTASEAGVPVAPAVENPPRQGEALTQAAQTVGFPLLIKAVAGGGGKGMRIARSEEGLEAEVASAGREAATAFGDGRLFLERYIERPRHIEVQVLADADGGAVHLGERECSVQRRHQKIVEEAPSPAMTETLRREMTEAALRLTRAAGYSNAGTVEFIVDPAGNFYFLEMNTRLQVEHPVTELVTGIDLVQAQIRIAAGEPLWIGQDDVRLRGHAIECRVCAEDPRRGFLPSPGPILRLEEPRGPGLRVDSGIAAGYRVPTHYDPMLAKLCAFGATREEARTRMAQALRDYAIVGTQTNLAFLAAVVDHPAFAAGETHTHFIDDHLGDWTPPRRNLDVAAIAATVASRREPSGPGRTTQPPALSPWARLGHWRIGENDA